MQRLEAAQLSESFDPKASNNLRLANLDEMSKQEIRANHLLRTAGKFDREFVQEATQITPVTVLQTNKAQTTGQKK